MEAVGGGAGLRAVGCADRLASSLRELGGVGGPKRVGGAIGCADRLASSLRELGEVGGLRREVGGS